MAATDSKGKPSFLLPNTSRNFARSRAFSIPRDSRNELKEKLFTQGIETGIHYKPNHLLKKFEGTNCLKAEEFWEKTLTLPLHSNLKSEDILNISNTIKYFLKKTKVYI